MIEVNMTVNELTEDANMKVGSVIDARPNIKNPFIHLTMVNNNEPFDVRSISYMTIEDGNLVSKFMIASGGRTTYGDVLTICYVDGYIFAPTLSGTNSKIYTDLVNVELVTDDIYGLRVIDIDKEASATLIFYYNPLPPE